ncbi:MAG: MATE family efflux transporter [Butyrivibrio sp.]|nr:MATE family efflux transporter [Butyrivibrio sp.]
MNKATENNITKGPILGSMLIYFLTLLLGSFFQQLYNISDTLIVGNVLGPEGLASVGGSSAVIVNIFVGIFMGLSSGATVVIAQFYGAKRHEEVSKAVHTAIALAIVGGLIITYLGYTFSKNIVVFMDTDPGIVDSSVTYLRIFFMGMVFNFVYNVGAGILRAVGDSKRPLYVLMASCFINIFLDILFVIRFKMGVAGAAIATIMCQFISAVIVLYLLTQTNNSYKLIIKNIRFDMRILSKMIRIGLPAAVQTTMYTFSNMLIQTSVNSFGLNYIAAWAAYGKLDSIFWMAVSSLGIAVTTFSGQNYGAGQLDRVKKSTKCAFGIAFSFTIPISIIFYIWAYQLLAFFTPNSPETIEIGVQMMHFLAPFYVTYIGVEIFSGTLRGMGTAIIPMIITLCGICVLRVTWIYEVFPIIHRFETIEASYPITWIITSFLFLMYYLYFLKTKAIKIMPESDENS